MLHERIIKLYWRRALPTTTKLLRRRGGLISLMLLVPLALLLIRSDDEIIINANDSHYASFNSQNHTHRGKEEELLPIYELPYHSLLRRRFFSFFFRTTTTAPQ